MGVVAIEVPAPREGVENQRETNRLLRELLAFANRFRRQTFTWDPPAIPAGSTVDTTFTAAVNGEAFRSLAAGMPMFATAPSAAALPAGLVVVAFVPAVDTMTVRLGNVTALPINPPSGMWAFMGFVPP